MIKVYCDKCGKEINGNINMAVEEPDIKNRYYDDLTCGFKIGDEVITSTGEIGRITDICTCDLCKERGFYEPKVEFIIGTSSRYITNNDKRVNFRSFYKIGDKIFGNIDKDCIEESIKDTKDQINKLQLELIELNLQLNVIDALKKK